MKVSVRVFVEHRSSAQEGVSVPTAAQEYLPLPGASSCCGAGCCSTSSCSCSW